MKNDPKDYFIKFSLWKNIKFSNITKYKVQHILQEIYTRMTATKDDRPTDHKERPMQSPISVQNLNFKLKTRKDF